MNITLLGLGLMGRPMARTLLRAGFDLRGWNRSALSDELAGDIPRAASLREAAAADVCVLMLASQAAVNDVLAQLEPHLAAGRLVLDMSSSDPRETRQHAARLAARGVGWVDAPVSGGPEGAAAGALAIMAGGEAAHVERAMPILRALSHNPVRVGGPGAGHTCKVVNQVIVALTIEAVAEAITLAEQAGVDPRLAQEALRGGFADSRVLQLHGTRMIERRYAPGGRVTAQLKDLRFAQALAREAGLNLPQLDRVTAMFEQLQARGDGELDHSAVKLLLDEPG